MTVCQLFSLFISSVHYKEQMYKHLERFVLTQNQTYITRSCARLKTILKTQLYITAQGMDSTATQ